MLSSIRNNSWTAHGIGLAGLASALFFALQSDAASVLSLGTAGPGYYPAFMDPAGRVPIPTGAVPGFFFGLLILHCVFVILRRLCAPVSWREALLDLGATPAAFLVFLAMNFVPLYGARILLVIGLALYLALVALRFHGELRALINFGRANWAGFALVALGVLVLLQVYMLFSQHDYTAFILENKLGGKYKRNLMKGGIVLILLGWSLRAAWLWRKGRLFAAPGANAKSTRSLRPPNWLRRRGSFTEHSERTEQTPGATPGQHPMITALLLGAEVIAGSLILYSFLAIPEHAPLPFLFGGDLAPLRLLAAVLCTLTGLGLLGWRTGLARTARLGRAIFWATPLIVLNIPFFEYKHELITVALVTAMALLIGFDLRRRSDASANSFGTNSIGADPTTNENPFTRHATMLLLTGLLIAFVAVLGWRALIRFYAFLPLNLDLTVEHQALWTLSFQGYPSLSIGAKDGIYDRIYWPDHVPFFYYILAPVYRLLPRVETLLWIQTAFLAAGAIPVTLLTRHLLRSWTLGAVAGALYLLHPGFQLLTQWDVHEGAFAITPFLFALYFYETGRRKTFLFFLLLGGVVREEMGLFCVSVGLMLLLSRRDTRYGTLALLLGAAQFLIMSKVMQTYFGGLGHYERYYPLFYLDGEYNVQNILYLLLFNPLFFFYKWWAVGKVSFVLVSLAPLAFLPLPGLLRWRWPLLLAGLASTLLAVPAPNYTPGYQYSILLLVACFYLLPLGLRLGLRVFGGSHTNHASRSVALVIMLSMGLSMSYLYGTLFGKTHAISFMGEWNPDPGQIEWNGWIARSFDPPRPTPAQEQLRALLQEIPERVVVAAPERISTHLSGRAKNYTLPRIDEADYIVVHRPFKSNPPAEELLRNKDFSVWKKSADDQSFILKRSR